MIFTDTHTTDRPEGLQAGFFYLQYIQEVDARICTRTSTASVASLCFFLSFFLFNACRLFRSFIRSPQHPHRVTHQFNFFSLFLLTLTLAPSILPFPLFLPPSFSLSRINHSLPPSFTPSHFLHPSSSLSLNHFHSFILTHSLSLILTLTLTLTCSLPISPIILLPPSLTHSPFLLFHYPHSFTLSHSFFSPQFLLLSPNTHSVTLTFPLTFPLSLALNRSFTLTT